MKKTQILVGKTYSTRNGNAARKVLRIVSQGGELARPRWLGDDTTAPGSEVMLVEYEQVRGPGIGTKTVVFIDQFAAWAAKEDEPSTAEEVARLRGILRRVNTDLIPHLRETGQNAVDREISETVAAVRAEI